MSNSVASEKSHLDSFAKECPMSTSTAAPTAITASTSRPQGTQEHQLQMNLKLFQSSLGSQCESLSPGSTLENPTESASHKRQRAQSLHIDFPLEASTERNLELNHLHTPTSAGTMLRRAMTPPASLSSGKAHSSASFRNPSSGTFVTKLYEMVENEPDSIVKWIENGTSFCVVDIPIFEHQILHKYFRHRSKASLIRQLNFYSFHSTRNDHYIIYKHSYFRQGHPELLDRIQRRGSGQAKEAWFDVFKTSSAPAPSTTTEKKATKKSAASNSKPVASAAAAAVVVSTVSTSQAVRASTETPMPSAIDSLVVVNTMLPEATSSSSSSLFSPQVESCISPMSKQYPFENLPDTMSPAVKPSLNMLEPPTVSLGESADFHSSHEKGQLSPIIESTSFTMGEFSETDRLPELSADFDIDDFLIDDFTSVSKSQLSSSARSGAAFAVSSSPMCDNATISRKFLRWNVDSKDKRAPSQGDTKRKRQAMVSGEQEQGSLKNGGPERKRAKCTSTSTKFSGIEGMKWDDIPLSPLVGIEDLDNMFDL